MTHFKIVFSNPWLLLLLIPAAVLTLLPYFRLAKKYRRTRNRIVSVVLHAIVMVLCISVLSGMTFSYDVVNSNNEIILLVDASYSNREEKAEKDEFVQDVINNSGSDYKIGIVTFGYTQQYVAELSSDMKTVYRQYLEASTEPDNTATDISAALNYASGLFSNPKSAKIVLVSDGIETDGTAVNVIRSIAATGIKVDTVSFPNREEPEVQIVGVTTPTTSISVAEETMLTMTLRSNLGDKQSAVVTVYDNAVESVQKEIEISDTTQSFEIPITFGEIGLHALRFELKIENDTVTYNNEYYSYVNLLKFDNILIVENVTGEATALSGVLDEEYNVTVLSISDDLDALPKNTTEIGAYEQVILVNVAHSDMPLGFEDLLYTYVNDMGGGLFTVGGSNYETDANGKLVPHAYNRDDMYGTVLQKLLPVQVVDYTPPIAVMIIIDRSGSMGSGEGSKLEQAKLGALSCLDALSTRDFCGIMTLENSYSEEVRVTPVSQRDVIRNAINSIPENGGGTVFSGAIDRAGRALLAENVKSRHIILVTDGQPSDKLEEYGAYIDINAKAGITMSVIGVYGNDANTSTYEANMKAAAERGNGKYHSDAEGNIGTIMYNDLMNEAIQEIAYGEPFTPKINDYTKVVADIDPETMPSLTGYYGTREKAGAVIPLTGEFDIPIYAQWSVGAGKVGSFLSDLSGIWSAEFINDETGQKLIHNIINELFPTHEIIPREMEVTFDEDNYRTRMNIYTELEEGETIEVQVTPKSEDAILYYTSGTVPVTMTGEGTRCSFEIVCPGLYEIVVQKKDAEGTVLTQITVHKTFSYSEEYNEFPEEQTLLETLAKLGGGVTIGEDIRDVFASFSRYLHYEYDPRILFLILASVLFLLDIAVRKFKFKWIHEIVRDYRMKREMEREQ